MTHPDFIIAPFHHALNEFYSETMSMHVVDYDLIELTTQCLWALDNFMEIEDRKYELIQRYSTFPIENATPNDLYDGEILGIALSQYFDHIRYITDVVDCRDDNGILLYRLHQIDETMQTLVLVHLRGEIP